ncbi:MAG TPA: tyrosine-type recombinase/integrase [Parafilimonas sp.]|nr:tyrosine-type recombinase/integrase [Parafilimonas sp.]
MLLPLKPICTSNKIRKDGTSLIFLQYCKSHADKTLLNTELSIPPKYWHKKLQRVTDDLPPQHGDAKYINTELNRMFRIAEDIVTHAIQNDIVDTVQFLKQTFKPDFDVATLKAGKIKHAVRQKANLDFFFQFDDYIHSKQGTVTKGTMDVFKNLRLILKTFENYRKEPIKFNSIDINFYEEFVHYLTFEHIHLNRSKEVVKGFKQNTIGKNIKQLIVFLKNRKNKKIIPEPDLTGFKIMEEEADAVYLNNDEINKIMSLDLTALPCLNIYRNLLVFGCLTGLRFSDFSKIRAEDIRDRMLYKKQEKTKHWVVIPLRDEAYYIFVNCFKRNIPETSNPSFNQYIKEVGKLAELNQPIKHSYMKGSKEIIETKPKYEWITSHTCRRSFCTNEFLAGTPVELIMKISGHKSLKDFYRYIKIAPEQAGQRIKEIWSIRGEIS